MKHLKIFENYQTEKEVAKICKKYGIENWSINQDGLVDVDDDVDLERKRLTKLPLKFGIVSGNFFCSRNELTTVEGAPKSVDGSFSCSYNKLITLEGSPHSVDGFFDCSSNKLTTLEGAPNSVSGAFYCNSNQLTTLKGAPYSLGGNFWWNNNPLPPLIKENMKSIKQIKHILANQNIYHIYNKDGSINEYRFGLMMDSMD